MCNRESNNSIPVKCTTIKGTKMKFTLEEAMKTWGMEYRYISTLSLTSMLDGVGGQCHTPATLPLDTRPGTHLKEAGWAQGRSGWVEKILLKPECTIITYSNLHTVQTERNYKYKGPHY
jgi:hypothetical protein